MRMKNLNTLENYLYPGNQTQIKNKRRTKHRSVIKEEPNIDQK